MTLRVIKVRGHVSVSGGKETRGKPNKETWGIFINTSSRCICKGINECELEEKMTMMQRNGHIVMLSLDAAT
jgi:hypothetical protein